MTLERNDILHPGSAARRPSGFPQAPQDWTEAAAQGIAQTEGIALTPEHWEVVGALQDYFTRNEQINMRELHDALEEKFHHRGGMKHLYELLPGGPVAQGCRLAGLEPPAGASDSSFGSVQ